MKIVFYCFSLFKKSVAADLIYVRVLQFGYRIIVIIVFSCLALSHCYYE